MKELSKFVHDRTLGLQGFLANAWFRRRLFNKGNAAARGSLSWVMCYVYARKSTARKDATPHCSQYSAKRFPLENNFLQTRHDNSPYITFTGPPGAV